MRGPRRVARPFAAVLASDLVSTLGSEMTAVALPWFVLVTTGSAARMAGVLAAEFGGIALLGLPGGRLASWLGARRSLLGSDAVRAALVLLIPVLHWAGGLSYGVLLAIGLVVGGCFPAHAAAQRVVLATVSGDDELRLTRIGGALGAVNETASFVGPALGGALIALVGAPWVLVLDAGSYLASFLLVALLVPPQPAPAERSAATGSGLSYLVADPPLRRQLLAVMVAGLGWTALMAALPVAARSRYAGGAQLAGALVAAYGAGSVVGAVVVSRATHAVVRRPGLPLVAIAAAMWVAVPRPPAWLLALTVAVFGVGNGMFFPRLFTALTLRPPERLRTSVMTAAQVVMSVTSPVGFVAGGLLLEHVSITATFVLVAVSATVAALVSVTGQPLRTGVDVERAAAQEPDKGESGLVGERDRE